MTYHNIIAAFQPKLLKIEGIDLLVNVINKTNFLVSGEIHGIQENAHVIYTLVHSLGIERIAIEVSPSVKNFIDLSSRGEYDFSQIDIDIFDTSPVSIEVAKTLAVLIKEGAVQEVVYIDTYFDSLNPATMDDPDSPQVREQQLADNILALDNSLKTLCVMGRWHTKLRPVKLKNNESVHASALIRVRQVRKNLPVIHNIYRSGQLYNDGQVINLPDNLNLPLEYTVEKVTYLEYNLNIPLATKISLPE